MIFARPPGGFSVVESENVARKIEAATQAWPGLAHAWIGLKARLAMVGHREGTRLPDEGAATFVYVADAFGLADIPEIKVLYRIRGADLILLSVLVIAPSVGRDV